MYRCGWMLVSDEAYQFQWQYAYCRLCEFSKRHQDQTSTHTTSSVTSSSIFKYEVFSSLCLSFEYLINNLYFVLKLCIWKFSNVFINFCEYLKIYFVLESVLQGKIQTLSSLTFLVVFRDVSSWVHWWSDLFGDPS